MPRIPKILVSLLLVLHPFLFCAQKAAGIPDYMLRLASKKDFDALKGEPLSKNFNGIECVKILYKVRTGQLYYIQSRKFRWHYTFAADVLGDPDELGDFNRKNYSAADRNYILATFNYNANTGSYFLQFAPCDDPGTRHMDTLIKKISQTFFKQKQFRVLLNSTVLLRRQKELAAKYEVMSSDELFKNQNYQPICQGRATGLLKFVHADSLKESVNYANCILVLNGSSNQLPVCRGVITNQFQTPLSHICLLTNNRHTPCAAQKNILSIDSLKLLNNQLVELQVSGQKIMLNRALAAEQKPAKPKAKLRLSADTGTKEIAGLEQLSFSKRRAYGSKACNLAELRTIKHFGERLVTPSKAFAIPFCYYTRHLQRSGAGTLIKALLADSLALTNDSILALRLAAIRKAIKQAALDTALLNKVTRLCGQRFGSGKVRFRSSSNCEDEAGFNGAGLYTSATGIAGSSDKSYERAIKKVWASLWSVRAYRERALFNFEPQGVSMAVLVHQAFDNEEVNGVAITRNLYRDYDFGFVINMQKGEEEVVSPKPGITCEQVVSYMNNSDASLYNNTNAADWISFSSLHAQGPLLSVEELKELSAQLESIKSHFFSLYKLWLKTEYKDFAMDVEFKVIKGADGKRTFLFKQARPYNG